MAFAALPTTLFQRLQNFLRAAEFSDRLLASAPADFVPPAGRFAADAPALLSTLPAPEEHQPQPARIALFERAGTFASPVIRWATASEASTACFNLERSTDGRQWSSIHLTAATGTAHRGAAYAVPVRAARGEAQMFRVRQTLLDGTVLLSDTLTLEAVAETPARVAIRPGRVTDFLHLRLADPAPASITLRDARGTVVISTVVHGATARIDLGGMATGVYFLHFQQAGMEEILRFEKE